METQSHASVPPCPAWSFTKTLQASNLPPSRDCMRSLPKNSSARSHSAIVSFSAVCCAGPSSISASSSITAASSTVFVSASNGPTYARSAFVAAMTSLAFAWLFQNAGSACFASREASFARRSAIFT